MISTLQEVLDLVGTLDDSTGENSSRERFRNYLTRGIVNLTAPLCTAPAQCGILVPQPELLVRGERFPDTDPPS